VVGALKMYRAGHDMEERDARVAIGLARVFSVYLEVAELDARAALVTQAELEALRAQISPHFLFNTLTTIAALTRTDPSRAHDLLVDFAEYFRETLARHGEFVTLDDELENVERYLRFEHARFGANLQVAFEVDARSRLAHVPVLSIQPLVENAIAHGIGSRNHGSIRIRARFQNAGVEISIIDDGVGIAADRVHSVLDRGFGAGLGLGLNNVHQRLIGAFGPRSGLQLASAQGTGTTVAFWLVRSELVYALARVAEDFTIVEAATAATALAALAADPFDVVFLDIGLPGMSGIEAMTVINSLPHRPHVVFVTAFDDHALRAFELGATDYVVKPVNEERLAVTVARLRDAITPQSAARGTSSAIRLPLEDDDRRMLVRISEIRMVHANGHVVLATLADKELRFRGSLADCAVRLEPLGFLRIHRSYLVNPDHVIEIEPFFGGAYILRVDDKRRSEAPVSRGYMPVVRRAFGL
jgi:DNA-binding LytR/AlgR family response regulator